MAAALLVCACDSNPQFRMNSANRAYGALNDLQVLLARAELGLLRARASFDAQAGAYAEIIAGFEIGRSVPIGKGMRSAASRAASRDALDGAITGCVDAVKAMAQAHRTSGLPAGSARLGAARQRCQAAVALVAENERPSIFISTVAGDL